MDRARLIIAASCALAIAGCGLMPPEPAPASGPGPQSAPPPQPSSPPDAPPPPPIEAVQLPPPGYRLVWEDDFDRSTLDTSRWHVVTGSRRDAQNAPDALTLQRGVLRITTSTERGVHETGFLTTEGLFDATYGYFEARIRFVDAPGEWCAFWLQSPTNGQPMGDPARAGVEIDVVEHRVTDQGGWQLADYVALNLNWDGYGPERQNAQRVTQLPDRRALQGQWHTYSVLWTETGYVFYVDALPLWSINQAVSRRPETLQLTCEVADASWAGFIPRGGYGPRTSSAVGMEVDWVRVWQKEP